jgi:NADH-quinone oxidoreductase subunit N
MAFHWLTIYLGLTLLSLTSALLISSQKNAPGAEASLKYLLYSMVVMALTLWGISYYYGFTGTLALRDAGLAGLTILPEYAVLTVLLLCTSSILFVLVAVPYHFWMPDVYQGGGAIVLAYLSTIPKLAAVAVFIRLHQQLLSQLSPALQDHIQYGLALLALLTIVVGNTAALLQSNLQRMMAYATMAQSGLLMAGIVALPSNPIGVLYYSSVYGIMNLAGWLSIKIVRQLAGGECLQDFVGLGRQFPLLGCAITLVMLSLIGLPPTAGFTGKWLLFTSLWEHAQHSGNVLLMVLLASCLLSTLFSLYYYLRLPYVLFCKAEKPPFPSPNSYQGDWIVLYMVAALLVVAFFAAGSLVGIVASNRLII